MVLRHQLNVLRRRSPKRPVFGNIDRLVLVGLYALAPGVLACAENSQARDGNPLASRGFSRLLALEVPTTRPPEYGG